MQSDVRYEYLKTNDDLWHCMVCVLKYNLDNVPFNRCDNSELNNNSMRFLESLPNVELVNEATQFSNVSLNEARIEILSKSCSNYHSVEDFNRLNINGIESKFDNL